MSFVDSNRTRRVADAADTIVKIFGAVAIIGGLLTAFPAVEKLVKLATGTLFGVTGTVYFEFDERGGIAVTPASRQQYQSWAQRAVGADCVAAPSAPACAPLKTHADYTTLTAAYAETADLTYPAYCAAVPDGCTIDGGLYLIKPVTDGALRQGARVPGGFGWGSLMQAATIKTLRVYPQGGCGADAERCRFYVQQPEIFALDHGDCVIVRAVLDDGTAPVFAHWGGWLKVTTTACGLFN